MKTSALIVALVLAFAVASTTAFAGDKAAHKYVGVKTCAMCHKTDKIGNQFGSWQSAKHSQAYKVLTTPEADKIAKDKGSSKPAVETADCLGCHTVQADAAMKDAGFDVKDGVQCEACHGAGSDYKSITVMKDKAKAVAAGMTDFSDAKATEAFCKKCHNEKSPTFKGFKFEEYHAKIKHLIPKKS